MINSVAFAERLQMIMDYYTLNASAFADRIGVQRSGISHILAGRNKPSLDFILKLIQEFEGVDLYWLLMGKGSFPPAGTDAPEPAAPPTEENPVPQPPAAKKIPEVSPEKKHGRDIVKIILLYENGSFDSFEN